MGHTKVKTSLVRLAAVTVLVLAGCTHTPASGPVDWDDELDFGVPGEVLETHANVPFYPACGNEVLSWEGANYFPYNPTRLDSFPDPTDQVSSASARESAGLPGWARMSAPMPAIVLPGPGDDTGTLVVYEGGHAYWQSANSELSAWLTTTEVEYLWVC